MELTHKKTVCDIKSHYRPIVGMEHLQPKVVYTDEGVFYDPKKDKFYYIKLEHADLMYGNIFCRTTPTKDKILQMVEVEPVQVLYPHNFTKLGIPRDFGGYDPDGEEISTVCENCFHGEADDLSCYVYFTTVNAAEN